jgi:hypothetical protein
LRYKSRILPKTATISQKTQLATGYQRFAARVKKFEEQATQLMRVDLENLEKTVTVVAIDSNENGDQAEDDLAPADDESTFAPKLVVLSMPSSIHSDDRTRLGWENLAGCELELRTAQAQDALRGLRQALGERSLCFQKVIRISKSQETSTRARGKIGMYDKIVNKYKKEYKRASQALCQLGESRINWPELKDEHLKMKSEYDEEQRLEARMGESSYQLPWIWTFDGVNISADKDGNPIMDECECK